MKNQEIIKVIGQACKRIAPAWPLKNVVAVNPYLGFSEQSFNETAKTLSERGGISMNMPISFYLDLIEKNEITQEDLETALRIDKNNHSVSAFLKELKFQLVVSPSHEGFRVKTVVDAAEQVTKKHWNEFMVDKISDWTSSYYDVIMALWNTSDQGKNVFKAWKQDAEVDLSTELMGIKNFKSILKTLPNNAQDAAQVILKRLDIPEDKLETYLHTLLLKIVGWSSFVSGKDWDANLYGSTENSQEQFLSILLCWEYCLLESFKDQNIEAAWSELKTNLVLHEESDSTDEYLEARIILQDAYDLSCQRALNQKFSAQKQQEKQTKKTKAQMVFCIDVRSEVYRRNLEAVDSSIDTLGFAGFFGFPINYVPLGHSHGKNQCPVLLPSGPVVKEAFSNNGKAKLKRVGKHQMGSIWKSFRSGSISSFSFVSPLGLSYLPKLLSDSFGLTRPVGDPNEDGLGKLMSQQDRKLDLSEIALETKISMAAGALTAMGLKENLAQFVLIAGHGSTSVNNPHATGLDCGACGGHSGEINAMTAAQILNDAEVRKGLEQQGIQIPNETHFVACLHDTTTDDVKVLTEGSIPASHLNDFASIKASLKLAGNGARLERAGRMTNVNGDVNKSIRNRSKDWSQVRPEWGLSGCNAFVVAPRSRTKGINLEGKSFLQSYDWKTDEEFKILESIMTAPMVVTSWINLQYYSSTTDNLHFGAGNKTLHNVTGGVGVVEGSGGDIRIGLPAQSLHDGVKYQHLPNRLNVVIEAPLEAINTVIQNHPSIKDLCDNSWITLLQLGEDGKIAHKYKGNLSWSDEVKKAEKVNSVSH